MPRTPQYESCKDFSPVELAALNVLHIFVPDELKEDPEVSAHVQRLIAASTKLCERSGNMVYPCFSHAPDTCLFNADPKRHRPGTHSEHYTSKDGPFACRFGIRDLGVVCCLLRAMLSVEKSGATAEKLLFTFLETRDDAFEDINLEDPSICIHR
jgi:hypothetical protein